MKSETALTPKEQEALVAIHRHVAEHAYPPSVRELAAALGLRSASSALHLLQKREGKGQLRREAGRPRALAVISSPML
jgi:repressor LexA